MEEWIQTLDIPHEDVISKVVLNQITAELQKHDGVDSWVFEEDRIEIFFNPYVENEKNLLSALEKSNKKNFGNKKLDCCELND